MRVAQWGFRRALWAAFISRIRPWFMLCRVVVRSMKDDPPESDLGNGITIRQASYEDLLAAIDSMPSELNRKFIDGAFARGDLCVAAFDGSKMVASTWASFDTAPHGDGLWVKVEPPYKYSYKSFTHEKYRGRGLIGEVTRLRDSLSVAKGCQYAVGFIETHNYASLQANRRQGSRTVGYAGYLKAFGKTFPFRSPGVVSHTFRFFRHC